MKKLLNIGNSLFFLFGIFWLYFSIYFLFEYLNIVYIDLKSAMAKLLVITPIIIFIGFHFRKFIKDYCIKGIDFLNKHKIAVMSVTIIFQLLITLVGVRMANYDASYVYLTATDPSYAISTDYISLNPNNYFLVIWMKVVYLVFQENTMFALALFNIFFIDASIYLIYLINKACLKEKVSDLTFFLLILILGFSPQHIYLYSDPINLFFLTSSLYLGIKAIYNQYSLKYILASAAFFSISYAFRPTGVIFLIAGFIVVFTYWLSDRKLFPYKSILKSALAFVLTFGILTQAFNFSLKHQNFVKYEENHSRTMLYFVNLGLTYSGNNHSELPEEVLYSVGEDRNPAVLKDITRRLDEYDFPKFVGHIYYKYYWAVNEGMFGWFQERVLNEESELDSSWLKEIQDKTVSRWIRTYIYVEGENYYYYARAVQIIWIIISLGIAAYPFVYKDKPFQLWMQITVFGGLLFLMIFEAGRTRYLIQFLPAIITVSALGLDGLATEINRKKGVKYE